MNGIQNNSYRCNYALNALVHHSVVMCIPNVIKARGYVQKIAETIIGNSYSKSVPKTGTKPYLHRKSSEIKYSVNQYIMQIVFSLGYKNKPLFFVFGYPLATQSKYFS